LFSYWSYGRRLKKSEYLSSAFSVNLYYNTGELCLLDMGQILISLYTLCLETTAN